MQKYFVVTAQPWRVQLLRMRRPGILVLIVALQTEKKPNIYIYIHVIVKNDADDDYYYDDDDAFQSFFALAPIMHQQHHRLSQNRCRKTLFRHPLFNSWP